MAFDTKRTPDYSPLVVHFTKNAQMVREDLIIEADELFQHRRSQARDRLMSILVSRVIYASPMPFLPTNQRAVCFTECIWEALAKLADQYSPYGIVFNKRLIFDLGGGPALYVRGDTMVSTGDQIPQGVHPFIAPFDPDARIQRGVPLDWVHEREWRLPHSLEFEYSDVQHVIVESIQEASDFVNQLTPERLPQSKIIPMEVYRSIKEAWRTE